MVNLYEILIPTTLDDNPISKEIHKKWDSQILKISNGMTILTPVQGQWIPSNGNLLAEKMLPIRIACTREQIYEISDFSAEFYCQKAIMFYKISDEVIIKEYS